MGHTKLAERLAIALAFTTLVAALSSCLDSTTGAFTVDSQNQPVASTPATSPTPTYTPPCSDPTTYNIQVSWAANRESAVNSVGGGYHIYYSTSSPVNTSSASHVDAPYISGSSAPTQATVSGLVCGTYHFRVVAFSAVNPSGSVSGSRSADSSEIQLTVP